jgi:hypothetical protein
MQQLFSDKFDYFYNLAPLWRNWLEVKDLRNTAKAGGKEY